MKYSFKILFTFSLMIICHKSFSQNSKNVSREIQEIKLIFKYLTNENTSTSFNLTLDDTLTLPPYFTSYRKYYDEKLDQSTLEIIKRTTLFTNETPYQFTNISVDQEQNLKLPQIMEICCANIGVDIIIMALSSIFHEFYGCS